MEPQVGETALKVVKTVEKAVKKAKKEIKKVKAKVKAGKNKPKTKAKTFAVPERTAKSAALKVLKLSLKDTRIPGECLVKGCTTKTVNSRCVFCQTHKKAIRKVQLKLNNGTWYKRIEKGTAKHHVAYRNDATEWAIAHPDKALELAKKGHSIYEAKEVAERIAKTKAALKARAAKKAA